jgi:hypothetical protein
MDNLLSLVPTPRNPFSFFNPGVDLVIRVPKLSCPRLVAYLDSHQSDVDVTAT